MKPNIAFKQVGHTKIFFTELISPYLTNSVGRNDFTLRKSLSIRGIHIGVNVIWPFRIGTGLP